jgi:hypothetical protein
VQGRDSGAHCRQTNLGGPIPRGVAIRQRHAAGDEGTTALVSPGLGKVQKGGALQHTLRLAAMLLLQFIPKDDVSEFRKSYIDEESPLAFLATAGHDPCSTCNLFVRVGALLAAAELC